MEPHTSNTAYVTNLTIWLPIWENFISIINRNVLIIHIFQYLIHMLCMIYNTPTSIYLEHLTLSGSLFQYRAGQIHKLDPSIKFTRDKNWIAELN